MSRWPGRLISKTPVTPGGPAPYAAAPGVWTLPEAAYWQKQGLWPDASADAYWPYVSFLMSTSALSNANNNLFVDSSSTFAPISRTGTPTQGSFSPYGLFWSNYFDGSGDYLTVASNAAFGMGTGDFTIECWVNPTAFTGSGNVLVDMRSGTEPSVRPDLEYNSSGTLNYRVNGSTVISGGTLVIGTWSHVVICRSGTTTKMFLNGTQVGSSYTDSNNYGSSAACRIGADDDGSPNAYVNGFMSNVRVVKGTAVYTSNFTPPTTPLTAISGTSLLTCQSNRFRDASSNNFAVTANGNTSVSAFSPFVLAAPGAVYNQNDVSYWSGYFDGSGDYLTSSGGTATAVGTGDFSVEAFVYWTSYPTQYTSIFSTRSTNNANAAAFTVGVESSGYVYAFSSAFIAQTSSGVFALNTWNHVVFTRSGTTARLFVNGVLRATGTNSQNFSDQGFAVAANRDGTEPGAGYVSNVRMVKGSIPTDYQTSSTTVGTTIFTPPTTPLTAISGTSLLTCQSAAFTDNSTNNFVITAAGNTTVSGANPFQAGYYSNYFDGTGDYLTYPTNAAFGYGTGDFTIEFWLYLTGTPDQTIFSNLTSASSTNPHLYYSAGTIRYYTSSADRITSSAVSVGQWYHVALSRASGSTKLFLNGAQSGSTYTDTNDYGSSAPLGVGTYWSGGAPVTSNPVVGYMSNVRVVKGTALYTSAFTPPTAPLTAISGTSVLTCQSNRFLDNSTNAFSLTVAGDPKVQPRNPFYTSTVSSNGGSIRLPGTSFVRSSSPAYALGTGNFTIEGWFWFDSPAENALRMMWVNYDTWAGGSMYLGKHTNSGGTVQFWMNNYSSGGPLLSDPSLPTAGWMHYAVVRSGNTFTLYRNGVSVSTASFSTAVTANTISSIGGNTENSNNYCMIGYVSDFRISGTAVYAVNFTPPTAPLTPTGATVQLVNGMNAGVYDASTKNDLTTVGSAQASAAQAKYGTTAAYFPAASSYLNAPFSQNAVFNTGDFTVEAWVYSVATTAGYTCILSSRDGIASNANAVFFGLKPTTNQLTFYTSGEIIGTTTAVSTGTWTHVALVRSSGTATIYINGTSAGTASFTTSLTGTGLSIGNEYNGASSNGGLYVDDLRITNGVARYTSNFTPPTAALPVY